MKLTSLQTESVRSKWLQCAGNKGSAVSIATSAEHWHIWRMLEQVVAYWESVYISAKNRTVISRMQFKCYAVVKHLLDDELPGD
jgi:hypothetical protein